MRMQYEGYGMSNILYGISKTLQLPKLNMYALGGIDVIIFMPLPSADHIRFVNHSVPQSSSTRDREIQKRPSS